jgi:hypothetical protein
MRDAGIRSDFLQPYPRRPREGKVTFGGMENRCTRGGSIATTPRFRNFRVNAVAAVAARVAGGA